ncbi:MAG: hypothetical protein MZV70_63185 [Desulfobacterales bacterium]|nr:hypothetical protein [Desulfobacterales bacterium]
MTVDPDDTVSLYLNSECPSRPSTATGVCDYAEGAGCDRSPSPEKTGKHADADTPTQKTKSDDPKKPDEYTAPLTGDIWPARFLTNTPLPKQRN